MKSYTRTTKKKIGELLIERGVISHEQLNKALEYWETHGGLIGEVLVELKFCTEKDIAQALTCQYGFPYLPLANYDIDIEVIRSVPKNLCQRYCLIPIDKIGKSLTLAMSNPLNTQAVEDVEVITDSIVQVFVATATEIRQAIDKYYKE